MPSDEKKLNPIHNDKDSQKRVVKESARSGIHTGQHWVEHTGPKFRGRKQLRMLEVMNTTIFLANKIEMAREAKGFEQRSKDTMSIDPNFLCSNLQGIKTHLM